MSAMGAVNAAATVAVLPLPALWIASRPAGPMRRRLAAWWVLCMPLACAWWVVPLLLQARYGTDFLPFTEPAGVTTAPTSAFEVVRGTAYWLSYLFVEGPWLPGGWTLVSLPAAIAGTVAVAALGLAGVARRDLPERSFVVLALGAGMVGMALAYAGPLGSPVGGLARDLLNEGLSPFRNVAKLDPVVRLPLALGVAHALSSIRGTRVAASVAAVAVVLAAAPVVRGEMDVPGSYRSLPRHWRQTAEWLDGQPGAGTALLVPAAEFGEYRWGRPLDEPLQALARRPWAVRDIIPLGTAGAARMLDTIDRRLAVGEPSPGLAEVLGRSGIRFVVVRNDVRPSQGNAPPPIRLGRALAGSPGIELAARFGPRVATGQTTDRLSDGLSPAPVRAVEIYEVRDAAPEVTLQPAGDLVRVAGGPESLIELADAPVGDDRVAVFGDGKAGQSVATDSRRRERTVLLVTGWTTRRAGRRPSLR